MILQIIDSINFYFYKLRLQIDELQSYSYFTEDQYKLISKLKKFNKKFQKKFLNECLEIFKELKSGINETEIYEDINKHISWYFQYFKIFNDYLSVIRTVENIKINQGIYLLIENFTKKISEKSRFIIFPKFNINCGYLDISKHLNKFTSVLNEKNIKDFLLFQIPSFNQNEILNNSILGHEIGHYVEEKNFLSATLINSMTKFKVLTKKKIEHIAKERFESEKRIDKDLEYEDYLFEYYEKWIDKKVVPWMKEIFSDIIGLRIFGLAFFFAFFDTISQTQSFGGWDHPPTSLRLKFLINGIKKTISDKLDKFKLEFTNEKGEEEELGLGLCKKIDFIEKKNLAEIQSYNQVNEPIMKIFETDELSERIYEIVNDLVKNGIIKEYSFNSEEILEIIYLMKLLEEYIIPNENEISKPVNVISIINAGWFFYLFKMEAHFKRFGVDLDDLTYEMIDKKMLVNQKLQNLLLKAIELSKIQGQLQNKIMEE